MRILINNLFSCAVACEHCLNSPQNVVLYEGTKNAILNCGLGPGAERWAVRPVTNVTMELQITNYTDGVNPDFTGLYAINQSGLIIRNTTTNSTGSPLATAGLYSVYFPDGNRTMVKVLVIRKFFLTF